MPAPQNLTLADTEELLADIRHYLSLEKIPANIEFWKVCLARGSPFEARLC